MDKRLAKDSKVRDARKPRRAANQRKGMNRGDTHVKTRAQGGQAHVRQSTGGFQAPDEFAWTTDWKSLDQCFGAAVGAASEWTVARPGFSSFEALAL